MSDQGSQLPGERPSASGDKIVFAVLGVIMVVVLLWATSGRQQDLRTSPTGLNGLQTWLSSEGIEAQDFTGGWLLDPDEVGLLIHPLYDTNLSQPRTPPETVEELLMQQDEFDQSLGVLRRKASEVPTLVVLPKWRSGMRLTGVAHPVLLSQTQQVETTLNALIAGPDASISYSRTPFTNIDVQGAGSEAGAGALTVTLYAAQAFAAPDCDPIVGSAHALILAACPLQFGDTSQVVFVLSDPDLINNHGLALGDNAFAVRDLVADLAGDGRVIIDYTDRLWFRQDAFQPARDRTWSDLMRFFSPPFTLIWIGGALAFVITIWRSGVRFGPVRGVQRGLEAAKIMAIGARARLMRLAGRDGALANEYARAKLANTATALFGPAHGPRMSSPEAFLGYVERQHPSHAAGLLSALNRISALPAGAGASTAMQALNDLNQILEHIRHDTRGTGHAG